MHVFDVLHFKKILMTCFSLLLNKARFCPFSSIPFRPRHFVVNVFDMNLYVARRNEGFVADIATMWPDAEMNLQTK